MLKYHAAFFPIEDDWYLAEVLDFPGVITQGRDLDDARFMVRDALKLMAECYLEEGKALPKPNPRARNKKARFVEPVYLTVRVTREAKREKSKTS
jgi:predicted RNase H-like HicB family nuclease